MNNMIPEAARYQHVLEFMYQCLISGLKGKYGAHSKGDDEIQKIINQLHGLLRPLRGETPKRLTDPLVNVAPRNYRIKRAWPLWTPWALAVVVLTVAYTIYSIRLNSITQECSPPWSGFSTCNRFSACSSRAPAKPWPFGQNPRPHGVVHLIATRSLSCPERSEHGGQEQPDPIDWCRPKQPGGSGRDHHRWPHPHAGGEGQ